MTVKHKALTKSKLCAFLRIAQMHRTPVKELRSRQPKDKEPVRSRTLGSSSFLDFKELPRDWRYRSSQFPPVDGYIFEDIYDKGVFSFHDL